MPPGPLGELVLRRSGLNWDPDPLGAGTDERNPNPALNTAAFNRVGWSGGLQTFHPLRHLPGLDDT